MLKACEHATRLLTRLVTSIKTRDFKRDMSFVYIPLCHENLALVTKRTFPQNVWPTKLDGWMVHEVSESGMVRLVMVGG